MSEQNPLIAIDKGRSLRNDEKKPARPSARRSAAFAPIRRGALPAEEEIGSYGTAEVLAAGLPAWNLEPPMAPVRRKRP